MMHHNVAQPAEATALDSRDYIVSFRRPISPDVHWVSYIFDANRLGPLEPESVDWKAHLVSARCWIEECSASHGACNTDENAMDPLLPTRILDISTDGRLRLMETNGIRGRYVALSYCWGSGQVLTTTTHNIQRRKAGIKLSDCPATIRDAILVCIELGCQYLWVDALCIIQNLNTDWECEASKMRNVYAESWLTIVAEAANTTECGFLHGRVMGLVEHKAPLNTRGWALQENLLAPRRLIYHYDSLSFECRSIRRELDTMSSCRDMATSSRSDSYDAWERIVREYSSRHLTIETDIFPALSGLAEMNRLQRGNQDSYLAGLWKENLLPGLLWMPEEQPGPHRPRLIKYRAPSWSWASYNWRTSYLAKNEGCKETYVAQVVRAETSLKVTNQYGEVIGGVLKIHGLLERGRVFLRFRDESFYMEDDSWVFGKAVNKSLPLKDDDGLVDVILDDPPRHLDINLEPIFLLLIRLDEEDEHEEDSVYRGLVLKPSEPDGAELSYQRIGVFVISKNCGDNEGLGQYPLFEGRPETVTII